MISSIMNPKWTRAREWNPIWLKRLSRNQTETVHEAVLINVNRQDRCSLSTKAASTCLPSDRRKGFTEKYPITSSSINNATSDPLMFNRFWDVTSNCSGSGWHLLIFLSHSYASRQMRLEGEPLTDNQRGKFLFSDTFLCKLTFSNFCRETWKFACRNGKWKFVFISSPTRQEGRT